MQKKGSSWNGYLLRCQGWHSKCKGPLNQKIASVQDFFSGFFLIESQSEGGRKWSNIKAVFKTSLFKEKSNSLFLANSEITSNH